MSRTPALRSDAANVRRRSIGYADERTSYWLAEFNALDERGEGRSPAAIEALRKAQYWLDLWNKLQGDT